MPITLGLIAAGSIALSSAWTKIGTDHDEQMDITASIILAVYKEASDELKDRVRQNNIGSLALRVWDSNSIEYATRNAVDFGPRPREVNGFIDRRVGSVRWRFLILNDPQMGITVELAEPISVRVDAIAGIVLPVFMPLLILLLALPGVVWVGLRRALRPLALLSAETARRSPEDLSSLTSDVPAEVHPLVAAINHLLSRLARALEQERQLTGMAAHELRTPLTVIKTRLQSVLRSDDELDRREGLKALDEAVDRAGGLVGQLLTLARLGQESIDIAPLDLTRVARDVAADLSPLALRKSQTLSFDGDGAVIVMGQPDLVALILRNLLDNAIKYTSTGGAVSITVTKTATGAGVVIADTGPGMRPERLSRATERFYRDPSARETGSGLGLSIALGAAELTGARLGLANREEGPGLIARLDFATGPSVAAPGPSSSSP